MTIATRMAIICESIDHRQSSKVTNIHTTASKKVPNMLWEIPEEESHNNSTVNEDCAGACPHNEGVGFEGESVRPLPDVSTSWPWVAGSAHPFETANYFARAHQSADGGFNRLVTDVQCKLQLELLP